MALELPVDLFTPNVANAEVGQEFFLVPWSLTVDLDGRMFVAASARRRPVPGGTVCMRVVRRPDGVAVDLAGPREAGHTWSPTAEPYCGNATDTSELLPVVELLDEPV